MPQLASILLVDDDATTNFLNKLLLTRLGVAEQLLFAENGLEALTILREQNAAHAHASPALILLDVSMPVMNGIEFLEAYQQLPAAQRQAIVVVLLTTSVNPSDLARVAHLPIAGTLNKPLTEAKVRTVLADYFPA